MKSRTQRRSSESIDDYLKAIYSLGGSEQRRVGSSELAERLGVAPASITNMLQKLAAQRRPLIQYERGRGVRLSAPGRKRALEIVRHHRLVETFLYEVLGYPLNEAAPIALSAVVEEVTQYIAPFEVRFVLFGPSTLDAYVAAAEAYFAGPRPSRRARSE